MSNQSSKDSDLRKKIGVSKAKPGKAKPLQGKKTISVQKSKLVVENGGSASASSIEVPVINLVSSDDDDEWMDHLGSSVEDDFPDCSFLAPAKSSTKTSNRSKGLVEKIYGGSTSSATKHLPAKVPTGAGGVQGSSSTVSPRTSVSPGFPFHPAKSGTKSGQVSSSPIAPLKGPLKSTTGGSHNSSTNASVTLYGGRSSLPLGNSAGSKHKAGLSKPGRSVAARTLSPSSDADRSCPKKTVSPYRTAGKPAGGSPSSPRGHSDGRRTPPTGGLSKSPMSVPLKLKKPKTAVNQASAMRRKEPSRSAPKKHGGGITGASSAGAKSHSSTSAVSVTKGAITVHAKQGALTGLDSAAVTTPVGAVTSTDKRKDARPSTGSVSSKLGDEVARPHSAEPERTEHGDTTCSRTAGVKTKSADPSVPLGKPSDSTSHSSSAESKKSKTNHRGSAECKTPEATSRPSLATTKRTRHPSLVSGLATRTNVVASKAQVTPALTFDLDAGPASGDGGKQDVVPSLCTLPPAFSSDARSKVVRTSMESEASSSVKPPGSSKDLCGETKPPSTVAISPVQGTGSSATVVRLPDSVVLSPSSSGAPRSASKNRGSAGKADNTQQKSRRRSKLSLTKKHALEGPTGTPSRPVLDSETDSAYPTESDSESDVSMRRKERNSDTSWYRYTRRDPPVGSPAWHKQEAAILAMKERSRAMRGTDRSLQVSARASNSALLSPPMLPTLSRSTATPPRADASLFSLDMETETSSVVSVSSDWEAQNREALETFTTSSQSSWDTESVTSTVSYSSALSSDVCSMSSRRKRVRRATNPVQRIRHQCARKSTGGVWKRKYRAPLRLMGSKKRKGNLRLSLKPINLKLHKVVLPRKKAQDTAGDDAMDTSSEQLEAVANTVARPESAKKVSLPKKGEKPTKSAPQQPTQKPMVPPIPPTTAVPTPPTTVVPIPPTTAASTCPTTVASIPPTTAASIRPTTAVPIPPTTVVPTRPTTAVPTRPTTVASIPPTTAASICPTTAVPIPPTTAAPTRPTTAVPTRPTTAAPTRPTTAAPTRPTTAVPIRPTTAAPIPPTTAASTPPTTAAPTRPTTAVPIRPTTAAPIPPTTAASTPPTTAASTPPTTAVPIRPTTAVPIRPTTAAPIPPTTAAPTRPTTAAPTRPTTAAPTRPTTAVPIRPATAPSDLPETCSLTKSPTQAKLTRKRDGVASDTRTSPTPPLYLSPPHSKKAKTVQEALSSSTCRSTSPIEAVSSCARVTPHTWRITDARVGKGLMPSSPTPVPPLSPAACSEFHLELDSSQSSDSSESNDTNTEIGNKVLVSSSVAVESIGKRVVLTTEVGVATKEATVATKQSGVVSAETEVGVATKEATVATKRADVVSAEVGVATKEATVATKQAGVVSAEAEMGVATKKATVATEQVGVVLAEVGVATKEATVATKQAGAVSAPSGANGAKGFAVAKGMATAPAQESVPPVAIPTAKSSVEVTTTSATVSQSSPSLKVVTGTAFQTSVSPSTHTTTTATSIIPTPVSQSLQLKAKEAERLQSRFLRLDTSLSKETVATTSTSQDSPSSTTPLSKRVSMLKLRQPWGAGGRVPLILRHDRAKSNHPPTEPTPTDSSVPLDKFSSTTSSLLPSPQEEVAMDDSSVDQLASIISPQDEEYSLRLQETIAKLAGTEAPSSPSVSPRTSSVPSPLVVSVPVSKLSKVLRLPPPARRSRHSSRRAKPTVVTESVGTYVSQGVQADCGLVIDRSVLDSFLTVKVNEALLELKEQLRETERQVKQVTEDKARLEVIVKEKVKIILELTQTGFKPKEAISVESNPVPESSTVTKLLRNGEAATHTPPFSERMQPKSGRGKDKEGEVDQEKVNSWLTKSTKGTSSRCVPVKLRPVTKQTVTDIATTGPPVHWTSLSMNVQSCFKNIYEDFLFIQKLKTEPVIGDRTSKLVDALALLLSRISIPLSEMHSLSSTAQEIPGLPVFQLVSKLQELERILRTVRVLDTSSSLPAYVKAEIVWTQQIAIDILHWLLSIFVPSASASEEPMPRVGTATVEKSPSSEMHVGRTTSSSVATVPACVTTTTAVRDTVTSASTSRSCKSSAVSPEAPAIPLDTSSDLQLISLLQAEAGNLTQANSARQLFVLKHVTKLFQKKIREVVVSMVKKNMVVPPNLLALLAMTSRFPQPDASTASRSQSGATSLAQPSAKIILPKNSIPRTTPTSQIASSSTPIPPTKSTPSAQTPQRHEGVRKKNTQETHPRSTPVSPPTSLSRVICTKTVSPKQFTHLSSLVDNTAVKVSPDVTSVTPSTTHPYQLPHDVRSLFRVHAQLEPRSTHQVTPAWSSPHPSLYHPYAQPLHVATHQSHRVRPYPVVSTAKVYASFVPQRAVSAVSTAPAFLPSTPLVGSVAPSRSLPGQAPSVDHTTEPSYLLEQSIQLTKQIVSAFGRVPGTSSETSAMILRSHAKSAQTAVDPGVGIKSTSTSSRASSVSTRPLSSPLGVRGMLSCVHSNDPLPIDVCVNPAVASRVVASLATSTWTTPISSVVVSMATTTSTAPTGVTTPTFFSASSTSSLATSTSSPITSSVTSLPLVLGTSLAPPTSSLAQPFPVTPISLATPTFSSVTYCLTSPTSSLSTLTSSVVATPASLPRTTPVSSLATPTSVPGTSSFASLTAHTSTSTLATPTSLMVTPTVLALSAVLASTTSSVSNPISLPRTSSAMATSSVPSASVLGTSPTVSAKVSAAARTPPTGRPSGAFTPTTAVTTPTKVPVSTLTSSATVARQRDSPQPLEPGRGLQPQLTVDQTLSSIGVDLKMTSAVIPQNIGLDNQKQHLQLSDILQTQKVVPPGTNRVSVQGSASRHLPMVTKTLAGTGMSSVVSSASSVQKPVSRGTPVSSQTLSAPATIPPSSLRNIPIAVKSTPLAIPPHSLRNVPESVSKVPPVVAPPRALPVFVTTPAVVPLHTVQRTPGTVSSLSPVVAPPRVPPTHSSTSSLLPPSNLQNASRAIKGSPPVVAPPNAPSIPSATSAAPSVLQNASRTVSNPTPVAGKPHAPPPSSSTPSSQSPNLQSVPRTVTNPAPVVSPPCVQLTPSTASSTSPYQHSLPTPKIQVMGQGKGIVIKWTFPEEHLHKQHYVETYELFAWVSTSATAECPPITSWAKVGQIRPLSLPMQVTLTNFAKGQAYSFSVRALFRGGAKSAHSPPKTLEL